MAISTKPLLRLILIGPINFTRHTFVRVYWTCQPLKHQIQISSDSSSIPWRSWQTLRGMQQRVYSVWPLQKWRITNLRRKTLFLGLHEIVAFANMCSGTSGYSHFCLAIAICWSSTFLNFLRAPFGRSWWNIVLQSSQDQTWGYRGAYWNFGQPRHSFVSHHSTRISPSTHGWSCIQVVNSSNYSSALSLLPTKFIRKDIVSFQRFALHAWLASC